MKAKAGHKWVIILTLPDSKKKFICGGHEGNLALIPIEDGKKEQLVRKVLSWEDSLDASKWMKEFMKQMTPEQKEGFLKMRPDLGLIAVSQ